MNEWSEYMWINVNKCGAGHMQEYKREEEIYNLYVRTRKWEMFKVS